MKKKVFIGIFLLVVVVGLCVYLTNRKSENYNVTMETSGKNAETDTATVAADATSTAMIATATASTTTEVSTQVVTTGLAPTEVDKPVVTNKNENSNKLTVVIDPGHGKGGLSELELLSPDSTVKKIKDGGGAEGIVTKVPEYVVTMQVGVKLKALLEQKNVNVVMTKNNVDTDLGNIDRANVGNNNNANLTIRLHCDSADSSSATGASMLVPASVGYAKSIAGVSGSYGLTILNSLLSTAGMKNRGVSVHDDMTGFNWSKVPVVLVEMGFMSNPTEDKLLNDDSYQNKLAQGLSDGIMKALSR